MRTTPYNSGALGGFIYDFDEAGDGIHEHTHPQHLLHNIIVLQGAIELTINGRTETIAAGNVHDFDGSLPHRIRAAEPGTRILNLYLDYPLSLRVDAEENP